MPTSIDMNPRLRVDAVKPSLPYFFWTVQLVPVAGPTNTPVFMHWAAAASHCGAVTGVPRLDRLIASLHAWAPPEHVVGCLWPMRGTR